MSVAIGRSPFDILEIYSNGVMGGAHCSTFVSDLLHHTNIIYAADIDKLLFRNIYFSASIALLRVQSVNPFLFGRYNRQKICALFALKSFSFWKCKTRTSYL